MFEPYVTRWRLQPDGVDIQTHSSHLLPVRRDNGEAAFLKIALMPEEKTGAAFMVWWGGHGAAEVLAHEGDALLLKRAQPTPSLAHMARNGEDDEATRILCETAAVLHRKEGEPPECAIALDQRFDSLFAVAEDDDGVLNKAARAAKHLLCSQKDIVPLHGDIHHENVLYFGRSGWLAIDPKGLIGERAFDYCNILCNPDTRRALSPGRFARQMDIICCTAALDRERMLMWVLAWAGLSASWHLEEQSDKAQTPLAVACMAAAEIDLS
ncbi:aminoglycoside phosphotransferase family protein [Hoeflea prorocentri]|uniref:3'-kinase n=1 Tax=Hoeflea prorocentri TaxID=1922333 RepID=A0A9X3UGQ6_9HYPH|nr:aminoglycoside phosphotransferase family protein [Hoeflea prorocentri]MCY6381048.1 3'-kinase [Hoeflea prorocentri]MDA5398848.1 3'-kinase [Hoeflea prorocentri]